MSIVSPARRRERRQEAQRQLDQGRIGRHQGDLLLPQIEEAARQVGRLVLFVHIATINSDRGARRNCRLTRAIPYV
ncbi:MAG: hypothetical protein WD673_07410 [Alphaproteobacteria bacterium]